MLVNPGGIALNGAAAGTPAQKAATSHETGVAAADGDRQEGVSITSTAALMSHLEQSLGAQPPVDSERVAAISQAIAAGTYTIHSASVAAGFLQSERALASLPVSEI